MASKHSDALIALGAIALLAALLLSRIASASECGLIGDGDLRHLCYAQVGKSPGECGLISNADMRRRCYASAKR